MTGSLQPSAVPARWNPPDPPNSAVAAGLLQLFFGWFGLERFYVGSLGMHSALALGIGTVFFIVGFFILVPLSIWTFFGANVMFSGNVKDKDGRKLR